MNQDLTSTVIVINNNGMGHGESELTQKLMATFLNLLDMKDFLPKAICFYADGVKLAVKGSPLLEELNDLSQRGVQMLVCTTCLNYFDIFDQLEISEAGTMKDILEAQWSATKVITL